MSDQADQVVKKTKRRRGRPEKLTPEVQAKILLGLQGGNFRKVAAQLAGVSYQTFAEWLRKGRDQRRGKYRTFFEVVTKQEAEVEALHVANILVAAKKDVKHSKFFLTHGPPSKRWAPNKPQKVELTGKGGEPIAVKVDARDELTRKLDQLAARRAKASEPKKAG